MFSRKMSAMIRQRIGELRRALAESATPEAHVRLGTMLLKCNATREAERELRAAVALDPRCASAWIQLGEILLGRSAEEAVRCLNRVIELEPQNAAAHYHLGTGLHALGRVSEARLCVARASELGYRTGQG